jgi:hypothetical protein
LKTERPSLARPDDAFGEYNIGGDRHRATAADRFF